MFTTNLPSTSVSKNVWIPLTGVLSTTGLLTKLVNATDFLCPITGKLTSHFPQRDYKQGLVLPHSRQLATNIQEMNIFRSSLWQFGQWIWQFRRRENVTGSNTCAFTHCGGTSLTSLQKKAQNTPGVPLLSSRSGQRQTSSSSNLHSMSPHGSLNILVAHICWTSQWFCETWSLFDRIDENATRAPVPFSTSISLLLLFLTCLGSFTTVSLLTTGMSCLSSSITLVGFARTPKET